MACPLYVCFLKELKCYLFSNSLSKKREDRMIKSMTAFGRTEKTFGERTYTVEIRCLNHRYCDIRVHMPPQLTPLEERVKKLVATRISRGRVEIAVAVRHTSLAPPKIEVNVPLAKSYYEALCGLSDALGIRENVGIQTVLDMKGIITVTEPEEDIEKVWTTLLACLEEALQAVNSMRASEGKAICDDFQKRLGPVENGLSQIEESAAHVVSDYQNRLKEQIARLTDGVVELDPDRLAQEVALLCAKSDVTEEVVRAKSHLKQFRSMIESDSPVGRSLDFLLQELNREVNTIGSKVGDARLSQIVVTLKSELEKIREQVQNVE